MRQAAVQHRLAVGVVNQEHGEPSPPLRSNTTGLCEPAACQEASELRDRGRLDERRQRQLDPELTLDPRKEIHCQERVPAEIEVVVVDADDLAMQKFGPKMRKLLFCLRRCGC